MNTQPTQGRYQILDALRGVAVLLVICTHFAGLPFEHVKLGEGWQLLRRALGLGSVGVDLFFVLSGFIITSLLFARRDRPNYYGHFYARRALRILPLYVVVVIILAAARLAPPEFLWASAVFAANFAAPLGVYGPLWSLSVEEQFYIGWPAFVRNASMRVVGLVAAAIVVASPGIRYLGIGLGAEEAIKYWTMFRLDAIAMGVVIAVVFYSLQQQRPRLVRIAATLLAVCALSITALVLTSTSLSSIFGKVWFYSVVALGFGGIVLGALALESTPARRYLAPRFLRFYGDISYGLYLIHFIVLVAVLAVAARLPSPSWLAAHGPIEQLAWALISFVLSTAVAYLSRWHFEERFLQMKWGSGRLGEKQGSTPAPTPAPEHGAEPIHPNP